MRSIRSTSRSLPQASPVRGRGNDADATFVSSLSSLKGGAYRGTAGGGSSGNDGGASKVDTERNLLWQQRTMLDACARASLAQRPFGGKSYEFSPKFMENNQTWNKVGYGSQGVIKNSNLFHAEPARRSPLRVAPIFPSPDDRRASFQLNKAMEFRRREKGNSGAYAPGRSAWENNRGFIPLKIKKKLQEEKEHRVAKKMRQHDAHRESQEVNRVASKSAQQLAYFQSKMESQGYLNRQRGVGTGVGGLRSEVRRMNMGGHQVAHIVRGTETPWLGGSAE
tara:strand:- start:107 stop:946 length:840 start_codon:yes stop_codon:yes gene_type:complete